MSKLDERVCVVTGAGGGIGSAIALRLAHDGGRVVVADIDFDRAGVVAEQAVAAGGTARAEICDVTDRESVQALVASTVEVYGRVDVLFNNAGVSKAMRFLETGDDDYNRIMRVNAYGVFVCMQEVIKQMRTQGGGKIINTASVAGKEGFPLFAAYAASKFAVVSFTQSAAKEFGAEGITVNAFCPGVVTTQLWDRLDQDLLAIGETDKPGEMLASLSDGIVLRRLSTPQDIVGLASFMASADSDYITGQAINVDGGMLFH